MSLLRADRLSVARNGDVIVTAPRFALERGESAAIVGPAGSGKTLLARAIAGLLPPLLRAAGSLRFAGEELVGLPEQRYLGLRGRRVGFMPQRPGEALNPFQTVGTQLAEPLQRHRGLTRREALAEALRLIDVVQLPGGPRRLFEYPHECAPSSRPRLTLAIAIAAKPELLVADDPSGGLDLTPQRQLLDILMAAQRELGFALLLFSRRPGIAAALGARALELGAPEGVVAA